MRRLHPGSTTMSIESGIFAAAGLAPLRGFTMPVTYGTAFLRRIFFNSLNMIFVS